MLAIYGFHLENIFWKKSCIENMKFSTIVLPYKMCVTDKRTYVNRGCNLINSYLLTDMVTIPLDKLPCPSFQNWALFGKGSGSVLTPLFYTKKTLHLDDCLFLQLKCSSLEVKVWYKSFSTLSFFQPKAKYNI